MDISREKHNSAANRNKESYVGGACVCDNVCVNKKKRTVRMVGNNLQKR